MAKNMSSRMPMYKSSSTMDLMEIINNSNQKGGSGSILMNLLNMMSGVGGKEGAGIGALLGLLQSFQAPKFDPSEILDEDEKNPWEYLPPGAL